MNTENNKIIAEFMGWKVVTESDFLAYNTKGLCSEVIDITLKFNTNWNQLMWVIDKIEATEDPTQKGVFASVDIKKGYTYIKCYYCHNQNYFRVTKNGSKIEATYNACIEFINWYNSNKK
jgi:hypothetical protein